MIDSIHGYMVDVIRFGLYLSCKKVIDLKCSMLDRNLYNLSNTLSYIVDGRKTPYFKNCASHDPMAKVVKEDHTT